MMGFTAAPWGLDGARSPASLARLANRAAVKQSGIVNPGDLKVLPLSVPGNGVRIVSGGAVLENRYELDVNQAYVVEATSEAILTATDNFTGITSQGGAQSHLICVTVGDGNYSTAGHPWLTDANKPATSAAKLDYQYVRPWVIKNVPAGTTRIEDLPAPPAYPVYALARIDVPASTTAITSAMIVDLREVVNPRTKTVQWNVPIAVDDLLNPSGNYVYEAWPDNSAKAVYVPKWATKVYVDAWVFGTLKSGSGTLNANFRVQITGGSVTDFTNLFRSSADRYNILIGGPMSLAVGERGVTKTFAIWGTVQDTATMNGVLKTDVHSSCMVKLKFVEEAV
jgi:hypothetical protein